MRHPIDQKDPHTFAEEAAGARPGLMRELWEFLRHSKKWWLIPIILVLLIAGLLIVLSGSVLAPFIYPLF